jgi:hypothetical protein
MGIDFLKLKTVENLGSIYLDVLKISQCIELNDCDLANILVLTDQSKQRGEYMITEGLKSCIATTKEIINVLKQVDKIPDKKEILSLIDQLQEMKDQLYESQDEIRDLKDSIRSLENDLLEYKSGKYCPKCREGHFIMISERKHESLHPAGVKWVKYQCNKCQHETEVFVKPGQNY